MTTPTSVPEGVAPELPPLGTHEARGRFRRRLPRGSRGRPDPPRAAELLRSNGANALPEEKPKPGWRRFIDQDRSYMQLILVGAAIVSLAIKEWSTAVLLVIITLLNAVVGLRQEGKAESAIEGAQVDDEDHGPCEARRGRIEIPPSRWSPGTWVARRRRRGASRRPHRRGERVADRLIGADR